MMYFASFSRLRSLPLSSYERFFAFQFRVFFFLVDVDVFDASRFLCFSLSFSSPSIRRHTDIPLQKTTFFPLYYSFFSLYCSFTLLLLWCSSRRRNHSPVRCESHSKKRCIRVCALLLQTGHCVFFLLFVHTRFKRRFSSTHLVDFRFVPLTRRKKHACAETTTLDAV